MSILSDRLFAAALGALLMLLLPAGMPQAADPVAMVADLQGSATLTTASGKSPLGLLDYLNAGSTIDLPAGSKLSLVEFPSGATLQYEGAAKITFTGDGQRLLAGSAPKKRDLQIAQRIDLNALSQGGVTQGAITFRTLRQQQRVILLHPIDTVILSRTPLFLWQPVAGATTYRFTLADDRGQVIHEADIQGSEYALSQSLREGALYRWSVQTRVGDGQRYAGSGEFNLLDTAERGRILALQPVAGAPFVEQVLFAAYLDSLGLNYDAGLVWQRLADQRPDAPKLRERGLRR